jgi:hypothetical protein
MNNETSNQPAAAEPVPSSATGPRTEAGKAVSSQNARKHDLCSKTLRLSPEEWTEYNDTRARYARDLQPADDVEETLIDEICFNYWRLQQAREAELGIIDQHSTALHLIALYIRYRTGYERAFYKGLDQIQKRQRERRKQTSSPSPLRSAETTITSPVHPEPVHSAESEFSASQALQDQIEDQILENRVRRELCLSPLSLPGELKRQVEMFVSQNRGSAADSLLASLKQASIIG